MWVPTQGLHALISSGSKWYCSASFRKTNRCDRREIFNNSFNEARLVNGARIRAGAFEHFILCNGIMMHASRSRVGSGHSVYSMI